MTTEINILRIKEILKERNITSKALAREMGVSENSLSLAITGKRSPGLNFLSVLQDTSRLRCGSCSEAQRMP